MLLRLSSLVESLHFFRCEFGGEDGELIEAAVEITDGEFWFGFGWESPISDLGISDGESIELFFFGRLFLADHFTIEVMCAGPAGDIVGGDEMNPALAGGMIPDDRREVDVVEDVIGEPDREEEAAFLGDLPVRFTFLIIVGKEERVVLAVEAVNASPGGKGELLEFSGDSDADAGAVG